MSGAHEQQNQRWEIVASDTLRAEEILAQPHLPPSGVTSRRQLAITFAGAFDFQVGRSITWVDPSRLLFVEAAQDFTDHHVVRGVGHRSVILTPDEAALDELSPSPDSAFADRVRACTLNVQMLVQLLRRMADGLAAEELGIAILVAAIGE